MYFGEGATGAVGGVGVGDGATGVGDGATGVVGEGVGLFGVPRGATGATGPVGIVLGVVVGFTSGVVEPEGQVVEVVAGGFKGCCLPTLPGGEY